MTETSLGSTYRLQLHGLGLSGAAQLVPYLSALGIETIYLSPCFAAAPGSTHGYDVIDPSRIDPALGSLQDLRALLDTCGAHGMRVLLDIVPNHMSTDTANGWWRDVLARGPASHHAGTFDIDWDRHGGTVLLPVLGRPLSAVLEDGTATVDRDAMAVELDGTWLPLAEGSAIGSVTEVLERQHYRPAYWRRAATEGNYRRFFDINGLVGVRVEDPGVFERTHELIVRLCADDRVAGVRVDHVDGLADPLSYLGRLLQAIERTSPKVVLVEKILDRDEPLHPDWAVDGTTGYEFGDVAGGLLIDGEGAIGLAAFGAERTEEPAAYAAVAGAAKREELDRSFRAELDRLTRLALRALDESAPGHDLSHRDVRRALAALTVNLDVYRTYLDGAPASLADGTRVAGAAHAAVTGHALDEEAGRALEIVADSLVRLAQYGGLWLELARRWQQLSGAVMAKGVEDTATYRYPGLLAHAEVGCDPDRAATDAAAFHRFARQRTGGLNATSTHDSKRNEDTRCRLAVLSEASERWETLVRRWHRRFGTGEHARPPHPGEELAVYQALLALWPVDSDHLDRATLHRVRDYLGKAAREAKRRTSWDHPDIAYERRLAAYVARVANDDTFRIEMTRFVRRIAPAAVSNTLALLVLKCCAPGTPDFYQGTELFAPTLTDPDNRRPVDFATRRSMLEALPPASPSEAAALRRGWPDGRLKLFVTRALLQARRHHRDLFDTGDYHALASTSDHVVAFARRRGTDALICLAPRLTWTLAGPARFPIGRVWGGARVALPRWARGPYEELFTGRTLDADGGALLLRDVLDVLPIAVLVRSGRL